MILLVCSALYTMRCVIAFHKVIASGGIVNANLPASTVMLLSNSEQTLPISYRNYFLPSKMRNFESPFQQV